MTSQPPTASHHPPGPEDRQAEEGSVAAAIATRCQVRRTAGVRTSSGALLPAPAQKLTRLMAPPTSNAKDANEEGNPNSPRTLKRREFWKIQFRFC